MTKDRLIAFTDAVLAIIMTILVLELEKPAAPTIQAFGDLRQSFFAYIVSFFWLGALWDGLATVWKKAEHLSAKVVWGNLLLLFFTSLIPYTTSLVSQYFDNRLIQAFYGIVITMTTIINYLVSKELEKENNMSQDFLVVSRMFRKILVPDIIVKVLALLIAVTVWPPMMSIGILVAGIYTIAMHIVKTKLEG